jgi:hypothetical protein
MFTGLDAIKKAKKRGKKGEKGRGGVLQNFDFREGDRR